MDEKETDCVYDNYYFKLNKKLQICVGLWPFRSRMNKLAPRIVLYIMLFIAMVPVWNGARTWCGINMDLCSENILGIVYALTIYTKYLSTIYAEKKLKKVYQRVAKNWLEITDPKEHAILEKYAKQGRIKSVGYIVYMMIAAFCFSQLPMIPIVLDIIMPLNESRPKILFVKGEYIIDPFEHFYKLYVLFAGTGCITIVAIIGIDTTYTILVHQIFGLISIVKYRLYVATVSFDPRKDVSFKYIINAVQLHKEALEFMDMIESSYSLSFLFLTGFTIIFISFGAIVVLIQSIMLDKIRAVLIVFGVIIHYLYICWCGQKLIDHTSELFTFTYTIKWYNVTERSKKLLRIIMLRCFKPCTLTAGGLYDMNFQNFGSIIKSAVSYITVLASFR